MFSLMSVIFVSFITVAITAGIPTPKCKDGQFFDETSSTCLVCDFLCSSCTSFGINVIQNGCICNSNVYKNRTSIYCALECPSESMKSEECSKASEFNFQNATTNSPFQTANDAKWLFLIAAILACCCFCCAG